MRPLKVACPACGKATDDHAADNAARCILWILASQYQAGRDDHA